VSSPAVESHRDSPPGRDRIARLRGRMRATSERLFVGRAAELALFRSAAAGAEPFSVLYVHGPGGIGKSMLLRKFALEAALAGRRVHEVDARPVHPPVELHAAAARALGDRSMVLLIDGFVPTARQDHWLWEEFLPQLPLGTLVVIAARHAPGPDRTCDPGWREALRVVRLGGLGCDEAAGLLTAHDVPAAEQPAMLDFACGHPLALALAARVGRLSPDVTHALLERLVGEAPSSTNRRALEVCAHVHHTTEPVLRVVLGDEAAPMFDWLRSLPFVDAGPDGLRPHDVLRTALAAEHRWRDPESYAAMHTALARHLLDRVRTATETDLLAAVDAFLHVQQRRCHPVGHAEVRDEPLTERDRDDVLAIAEEAGGPESAALTAHWVTRRPDAVRVHRCERTGRAVAFAVWLRLAEHRDVAWSDPAVAEAWAHARCSAAPRAGEHVAVSWFVVHPAAQRRRRAVRDLVHRRALAEIIRSPQLAWVYFVLGTDELPPPYLTDPVRHPLPERASWLVVHDRRVQPVETWLLPGAAEPDTAETGTDMVVLSEQEFHKAVRAALRSAGSPSELAANPLNRSRVLAAFDGSLRELLREAVDALETQQPGARYHRVVAATVQRGDRTQEAVARRLGLPFSTYRRHLARGVTLVGEKLWRRELAAG
jgi:hypothetical protein